MDICPVNIYFWYSREHEAFEYPGDFFLYPPMPVDEQLGHLPIKAALTVFAAVPPFALAAPATTSAHPNGMCHAAGESE